MLLCSAIAATPVAAQSRTRSAVAGAEFPVASRDWSEDADGSKAATLDLAASLAGVTCAAREAHAWAAANATAAAEIGARTDAVFAAARWSLEPVSHTPEGQRILLARRQGKRLVMVWQPEEKEIGLLLCASEPVEGPPPSAPLPEIAAPSAPAAAPPQPAPSTAPQPSRIDDAFGAPAPPIAPPAETAPPPPAKTPAVEAPPPEAPAPAPPVSGPAPLPAIAPPAEEAGTAGGFDLPVQLVAVLLLVAGGVGLIVRDFRARRADTAWQWPTTTTTIERGWVEEEESEDRRGETVISYLPVLKYRYTVDGEEFDGERIGLDDRPQASADAARRLLARYPNFTTVEIRYDPEDPSFAVIEAPRPKPDLEFYSGVGALMIALVVLLGHFL